MKNTKQNFITITKSFLLLVVLIFSAGCQSLMYQPRVEKFYDPSQVQLTHEDVYFKSTDGNMLHAWYFPAKTVQPKGTILFFHGNAQNITTHFLTLRWMPEAGYNYFIFDYPGYGTSSGKSTPEGTVQAGIAAAEWLMANKKPSNLIIYGSSLGGIIALRTAEEIHGKIPVSHIIIEGSFPSYQGIARTVLARSWITWILQPVSYLIFSDKWAPKNIAGLSPTPLLLVAGEKDPVIEPENSQKIFNLAADPKELWNIPKAGHGNWLENPENRQRLLNYLKGAW